MYESRGDDMIACLVAASKAAAWNSALLWWLLVNSVLLCAPLKSRAVVGDALHTEFLRVDYSAEGARGYINRAVVWVGEARPLSDEDVTLWAGKAVAAVDRALTCVRRGADARLLNFSAIMAGRALAKFGIPVSYIAALRCNGGAGIGMPRPEVFNHRPVRADIAQAELMTAWPARQIAESHALSGEMRGTEAETVALRRGLAAVASSAPVAVRRRQNVRPALSRVVKAETREGDFTLDELARDIGSIGTFGADTRLAVRFEAAAELASVREVSAYSLLSLSDRTMLMKVEKRYKFPRSVAVDWIAGKCVSNVTSCHPELLMLADMLTAPLAHAVLRRSKADARSSAFVLAECAAAVRTKLQEALSLLYSF